MAVTPLINWTIFNKEKNACTLSWSNGEVNNTISIAGFQSFEKCDLIDANFNQDNCNCKTTRKYKQVGDKPIYNVNFNSLINYKSLLGNVYGVHRSFSDEKIKISECGPAQN